MFCPKSLSIFFSITFIASRYFFDKPPCIAPQKYCFCSSDAIYAKESGLGSKAHALNPIPANSSKHKSQDISDCSHESSLMFDPAQGC